MKILYCVMVLSSFFYQMSLAGDVSWKNRNDIDLNNDFKKIDIEFKKPKELEKIKSTVRHKIKRDCFEQYRDSLIKLEESIADVIVENETASKFTQTMCNRLLEILEGAAYQNLKKKKKIKSLFGIINKKDIDKEVDLILFSNYTCKVSEAGCAGNNPERMRDIIKNGNIREKMFFIYNSIPNIKDLLKDKNMVQGINGYLKKENKRWRINAGDIDSNEPFSLGRYAKYGNKISAKNKVRDSSLTFSEYYKRVKLSENEKKYLLKMLKLEKRIPETQNELLPTDIIPIRSGDSIFSTPECTVHMHKHCTEPYSEHARRIGAPLLSKPSGTTDRVLTLAHYMGLDSQKDKESGVLALMGWMINNRDHSSHEILTVAQDFGLKYNMGPNFYKSLISDKGVLLGDQIEDMLRKRGGRPPQEILDKCHYERYQFYTGHELLCGPEPIAKNFYDPIIDKLSNKREEQRQPVQKIDPIIFSKTKKLQLIESLAQRLENDMTTYQWTTTRHIDTLKQNRKVRDVYSDFLDPKLTAAGRGEYVSLNTFDSAEFAKEVGGLAKITLKKGEKVLNLRDPEVLSKLISEGLTEEEVYQLTPDMAIIYPTFNRSSNVKWMVLKNNKVGAISVDMASPDDFSLNDLHRYVDKVNKQMELYLKDKDMADEYQLKITRLANAKKTFENLIARKNISFTSEGIQWGLAGKCILVLPDKKSYTEQSSSKCSELPVQYTFTSDNPPDCIKVDGGGVYLEIASIDKCKSDKKISSVNDHRELLLSMTNTPTKEEIDRLVKFHLFEKKNMLGNITYEVVVPSKMPGVFTLRSFKSREDAEKLLNQIQYPVDLDKMVLDTKLKVDNLNEILNNKIKMFNNSKDIRPEVVPPEPNWIDQMINNLKENLYNDAKHNFKTDKKQETVASFDTDQTMVNKSMDNLVNVPTINLKYSIQVKNIKNEVLKLLDGIPDCSIIKDDKINENIPNNAYSEDSVYIMYMGKMMKIAY